MKDSAVRNDILKIENRLSEEVSFYVPADNIKKALQFIQAGDIIAITSNRPGLDVEHTGIAIIKQGLIHLLHASSKDGKVTVSRQSLSAFVASRKFYSGIIILRPSFYP